MMRDDKSSSDEISICSKIFATCSIKPVTGDGASSSGVFEATDGMFVTTSFFLDTSGRSKVSLPLELRFENREDIDSFVSAGCILPAPIVVGSEGDGDEGRSVESKATMGFEVTALSYDDGGAPPVTVEGITILSSWIKNLSVFFDTEVVLWAEGFRGGPAAGNRPKINTQLEIVAVLSEKIAREKQPSASRVLDFGGIADYISKISSQIQQTRLNPIQIQVSLTDALSISVTSVNGASVGTTLVSLTICHSNKHSEPVTITNIALHPGHSRLDTEESHNHNNRKGQQYSVMDMNKFVQWSYAPQTEPQLPLTLQCHDAFSTVIIVEASEDTRSRTFVSPVTVAAVLGSKSTQEGTGSTHRYGIIASSDAKWTLGRMALEPSDAFRIDMNLSQQDFHVGEPFTVSLRVLNLSSDPRDIMLLVAKDIEKGYSTKRSSVNTAVVSEVNGYTFGVWGLLTEDDLKFRFDRDHDLLAVDTALLLGELKGRHSVQAQLRFNPLREGTLEVPNMQLFDKKNRKWYYCSHKLKIVAKKCIT